MVGTKFTPVQSVPVVATWGNCQQPGVEIRPVGSHVLPAAEPHPIKIWCGLRNHKKNWQIKTGAISVDRTGI
jgi:hypothetical protein